MAMFCFKSSAICCGATKVEMEAEVHEQENLQPQRNPENITLGSADCTFNEILKALNPQEDLELIRKQDDIASTLGLSMEERIRWRKDCKLGLRTMCEIYEDMIRSWAAKKDDPATLGELTKILKSQNLNAAAGKLQRHFGIAVTPDEALRRKRSCIFLLLLLAVLVVVGATGTWYFFFKAAEEPQYRSSLPEQPPFYISRTLVPRSYISKSVFTSSMYHDYNIFVVSHIERHKLSLSCSTGNPDSQSCKRTDTVANQLNKKHVDIKYLVLNQKSNFDRLCAKTNESVHWLEYDKNKDIFKWIKSRGSMSVIQSNIDLNGVPTENQNEHDWIQSKVDGNVILYGSPGIGKSTLLVNIGRRLQDMGHHVIFFSFSQFIGELQKMLGDKHVENGTLVETENALFRVLTANICLNTACEKLITSQLISRNSSLTLLFDGYHEILQENLELADICLKSLKKLNVQIIVTTRPYRLTRLENTLETLGHKILPFTNTEQIAFLTSYWSSRAGGNDLDLQRLHNFSTSCLKSFNSKIANKDRSVTGVALTCLLIVQVYQHDALSYSNVKNVIDPTLAPQIEMVTTIWELFTRLIDIKIKIYGEISISDREAILLEHAYNAIRLLFPHSHSLDLVPKPETNKILNTNLLKLGILTEMGNETVVFYHQTFANYFVAWFITNNLQNESLVENVNFQHFMFHEALCTHNTSIYLKTVPNPTSFNTHKFSNKMIAQFLDSSLNTSPHDRVTLIRPHNCSKECINHKLKASVSSDLAALFQTMISIFGNNYSLSSTDDSLLSLAVLQGSVPLVTTVASFVSPISSNKSRASPLDLHRNLKRSNLRIALRRGNYNVFEYLWTKSGGTANKISCLLHSCVCNSQDDSQEQILDRIQIIRFLLHQYNNSILEERQPDKCPYTPILCLSAHYQLILELVDQGAATLATNEVHETILHVSATTHSPENFHLILLKIVERDPATVSKLVKAEDDKGRTPLHVIVKHFEPLESTLQVMSRAGANFNSRDFNGASVLITAINSHRSTNLLGRLVHYGADVNHVSTQQLPVPDPPMSVCPDSICADYRPPTSPSPPILEVKTLLHVAVEWGDVEAVSFLLSVGLNPNTRTLPSMETSLDIAVRVDWRGSHISIAEVLILHGADADQTLGEINGKKGYWAKSPPPSQRMLNLLSEYSRKKNGGNR